MVAVRVDRVAISLRVVQGWQGCVRIHATSKGTMHHRVQCPIVLSPHPQAAHTAPLAGKMLLKGAIRDSGDSAELSETEGGVQ